MRAQLLLLLALAATATSARQLQEASGMFSIAVLNGFDAERHRFNYIASLRYPWANDTGVAKGDFVCTGVLVRHDIVVTTTWCVINSGVWPDVKLASYETDGGEGEWLSVVATAYHKRYNASADNDVTDDIALLLLNKTAKTPPVKNPDTVPNPPVDQSAKLTIAGWGQVSENADGNAPNLKVASQFLLTQQRCAEKWSAGADPIQAGGWDTEPPKMLCAGYAGHLKALCFGDNGAPLIRRGTDASSDLVVGLGAQSSCKGTGDLGGSIFTNLATYSGWIAKGSRLLRTGQKSQSSWRIVRKPECPSSGGSCLAVGRRCSEAQPGQCCSGKCVIRTCMP